MPTADDYADWIAKNLDKKGTPEFNAFLEAYKESVAEEKAIQLDIRASEAAERGAKLPTAVRGGLTAAKGLTFNLLDEIMGGAAAGQLAQSYAMGDADVAPSRADYESVRNLVRGATKSFAEERPKTAAALEIGGALSTIPFTMGASAVPAAAGVVRRGYEFLKPIVAQSALGAAGASEAETAREFFGDVGYGTLEGTAFGGGLGLGGKALGAIGKQVGPRLPKVGEQFAVTPARERLAKLLERDAEARITGAQDPILAAERQLRVFGPEAPLAATGKEATEELGLLRNLPGSQQRAIEKEARRIKERRGPALVESAEEIMGGQGVPFRATVRQYAQNARAKSAPFYQQLEKTDFDVDDELANIISRAKKAYGEAEELAAVSGMPQRLDLGKVQSGDRVPFEVLDNLKRTLYDIEEAAKGEFGKPTNKSRAYTKLRRDFIRKLDELSPKDKSGQSIYKQARQAFEGEAQLETAMQKGRDALKEDAEELAATMADLEPSQLEAFRMGALEGVRSLAGTPAGQTRILNLYREPTLQAKMRTIFGNDFRKFQRAIKEQEELRRVERAGEGSQTFKLGTRAEEQGAMMDALDLAQSAQAGGLPLVERMARKFSQLRMPEESRKELARLLLLRGEPAQEELRNMRAYMERRRRQQALAGQLAGRTGALTAPE